MWAKLKTLDVYPKLQEDLKIRTFSGATISIISGIVIMLLFFSELSIYLSTETVDRLVVDVSRGEKLQINFDVTFPHIPCSLMSVDAMDVSGSHQLDVSHNIKKQLLDKFGAPAGAEQPHALNEVKPGAAAAAPPVPAKPDPTKQPGYCGSCYGAEEKPGQCCNTCEDVRAVYRIKGWAMSSLNHIEQCVASGETTEHQLAELDRGDGCRLFGDLQVNKVAGNFHFAPGKSFQHMHMHIHDLASIGASRFNVSHIINRLSFGQNFPGIVNPLDTVRKDVEEGQGMVMYYVKVVPTTYSHLDGQTVNTNQFSVTEHFRRTATDAKGGAGGGGGNTLPGVFFFYELSPIMVRFTEQRQSLGHFLTQLCAILGGVFTVAGMLDRVVFSTLRVLEKKLAINKLT